MVLLCCYMYLYVVGRPSLLLLLLLLLLLVCCGVSKAITAQTTDRNAAMMHVKGKPEIVIGVLASTTELTAEISTEDTKILVHREEAISTTSTRTISFVSHRFDRAK